MAAIRSFGNKDTELKLAAIFRSNGITGWRRNQPVTGKPDFVFWKQRLAVFVDGCFWHGCPKHGRKPGSNRGYWLQKFRRNKQRDEEVTRSLLKSGWQVCRLWEHELEKPGQVTARIRHAIKCVSRMACGTAKNKLK
jgi:DNA mismatch endonuclease (patch repair protein)